MNTSQLWEQLSYFPNYFASHVLLSLCALTLGIAFSLPLAALAIKRPRLAGPMLGVAGIIQTIPGLALLALMVPLLGRIGVIPALTALVLYSMLPILRNAYTGLLEVDPYVIEAARGVGMTEDQILVRVRFPLAAPIIIAGIRTSAVWTVGMATLSTPVGATSLGNYIFSGLQTQNTVAVLLGCVGAALLAIALDTFIRVVEVAAEQRNRQRAWRAAAGFLVATLMAISPLLRDSFRSSDRPQIIVGAKTFTEQYILSELISERLRDAGFDVVIRAGLGSTVIFDALANGEIDVYVDYSGTLWANHLKRKEPKPPAIVLAEIREWLADEHELVSLGALGFENTYAFAMRRDRAEALHIKTLEDLAMHAASLSVGGDYEFFSRPEWLAVRDEYGMKFEKQRSFDASLMYAAVHDGHVDAISAFSTDGRIAAFNLVVLEDPRQSLPPYDGILLLSKSASRNQIVLDALQPLIGSLNDATMRDANRKVDLDQRPISEVAHALSAELPR